MSFYHITKFADHCYEIDTDYDVETGTGTDIEPTWEGILHDKDKALSCQHFCQKNEYCQFWTYTLSTYIGQVSQDMLSKNSKGYCEEFREG